MILQTGKPQIAGPVLHDAGNKIGAQSLLARILGKRFSVELEYAGSIGAEPQIALTIPQTKRSATRDCRLRLETLFLDRQFEFFKTLFLAYNYYVPPVIQEAPIPIGRYRPLRDTEKMELIVLRIVIIREPVTTAVLSLNL